MAIGDGDSEGIRLVGGCSTDCGGGVACGRGWGVAERPSGGVDGHRTLGCCGRAAVGQGVTIRVGGVDLAGHDTGSGIRSSDRRGGRDRCRVRGSGSGHEDVDDRLDRLGDCLDDLIHDPSDRLHDLGDERLNLPDERGDRVGSSNGCHRGQSLDGAGGCGECGS